MSPSKSYLDLPYVCGPSSICAIGVRAIEVLSGLGVMFGLDGARQAPSYPVAVTLTDGLEGEPLFTEREFLDFYIDEEAMPLVSIRKAIDTSSTAFLSVCGRLLLTSVHEFRPAERIALHGALLEEAGAGIVILADSGVGKSTTLRRHNLNGGCGVSDDWLMVNETHGEFVAQVLPTWSCILRKTATFFPISHTVPLRGIGLVAHADGSVPRTESVDELEFFIHAFNASEVFNRLLLKHLPGKVNKAARLRHIRMIDRLIDAYTQFKYFASLDDNPSAILFRGELELTTSRPSANVGVMGVSHFSDQSASVEGRDCRQSEVASSEGERRFRLSDAAALHIARDGARAVLINTETGSMFMLNKTGLLVCQAIIEKPRTIDEIVFMLGNVMRLPPDAARDVRALLGVLVHYFN